MTQALRTPSSDAFAPGRVLRVYGMRRSGNHALINWIMRNAPGGNGLFLNDCRHAGDPFKTAQGVTVFEQGSELPIKPLRRKLQAAGKAPFTVVSYEDRVPPPHPKPLFEAPEVCVIIYRSFLHWSASLLRKIQGNDGYGPLDRARVMSKSLCIYSDMLDRVQDEDVIPLCYDDWMADDDYRAKALERLDLPGRDLDRGAVQRYGGGSSFQGKVAKVRDLATDQRSDQMTEDLEYKLLLWTAARDLGLMVRLADTFPDDAKRLSKLLDTAKAEVSLP